MSRRDLGPWLFGPALDLALFAGSSVFALGLVGLRHLFGLPGELPEWGFLAFVLAIDVAHVYSTLFRTYLDRGELAAAPLRYAAVPLLGYCAAVLVYQQGALIFWRVLAYLALFHFVRQAAGWVAVYRARAGRHAALERGVDDAAIYSATLYPVLHWHAHLEDKHFAWFLAGDFVDLAGLAALLPVAQALWALALGAFFVREIARFVRGRPLGLGRLVVVASTALTWYVGIVGTNSDFDFTVTNVITHGVPYIALPWAFARARRAEGQVGLGAEIAGAGFGAFAALILFLAFVEELAWDRLVWHDRPWLFGDGVALGSGALAFVVPLLALPQLTHYVLDGFLWRRGETRRLSAQRVALGFGPPGPAANLVKSSS